MTFLLMNPVRQYLGNLRARDILRDEAILNHLYEVINERSNSSRQQFLTLSMMYGLQSVVIRTSAKVQYHSKYGLWDHVYQKCLLISRF